MGRNSSRNKYTGCVRRAREKDTKEEKRNTGQDVKSCYCFRRGIEYLLEGSDDRHRSGSIDTGWFGSCTTKVRKENKTDK